MSKYLDFIGQQISQSKSQQGSQNEDIDTSEESGIVSQVKKHGLKVAGGLAVVAGSVFAYKHFSKPKVSDKTDADVYFEETMLLEQDEKPTTKIHDFTSKQDAEKEGRGEEFEESMALLEANSPSMEEIMAFDVEPQDAVEEDIFAEMGSTVSQQQQPQKSDSLEELFGVQFSPQETEKEEVEEEGSAYTMDLPGADLFNSGSMKDPSMIAEIQGKFTG